MPPLAAPLVARVAPVGTAGELGVLFLGPLDEYARIERHAMGRGAFFGGARVGDDKHHDDIGDQGGAAREQERRDENSAHECHVDREIRGQSLAYAAEDRAVADLIKTSRDRGSATRRRAAARAGRRARRGSAARRSAAAPGPAGSGLGPGRSPVRSAGRLSRRAGVAVDGTHLCDDLRKFRPRDDRLVWTQVTRAFLADGLLEVGDDFGAIGVGLQSPTRLLQVLRQERVGVLVELIRIAVETYGDDLLHDSAP